MKRPYLWLVALLLALALIAGCGGTSTIKTPLVVDGKVVMLPDGTPAKVEKTLTDEAFWYEMQKEKVKAQSLPAGELHIPEGKDAVLPGGTKLIIRATTGVTQGGYEYTPAWARLPSQLAGFGLAAFTSWNMGNLAEVAILNAGARYNGSFNADGQSLASYTTFGNEGTMTPTTSDRHDVTDRHDSVITQTTTTE